ncbi:glycosyltransferase [Aerosakkonemataceae cyanobacterium BLCC-F50]|uniref:Glycosyltransferase n=1 Tax=Floridaenema flaviceps BLCC-F50 TaxID=3153642 RepID=A0ABV4XP49_9CYAN
MKHLNCDRHNCLSVVIPVYNEESTLEAVVRKVLTIPNLLEIVIVDDGSTDRTPAIGFELTDTYPQVRFIRNNRNAGKTEALKQGFLLTKGDIVIVQDADLEYDPAEIPQLIQPIIDHYADVVYGSRFLVRKAARVLYFYHYLGNKGLTFLSNLFTNLNMTDVETCYKAFRGDIIRNMLITSRGFGFEIEVTAKVAKLAKMGCAVYEVPISYYGRTYEEGKKIGLKDGFAALWYILYFNIFCGLAASFSEMPESVASKIKPKYAPKRKKFISRALPTWENSTPTSRRNKQLVTVIQQFIGYLFSGGAATIVDVAIFSFLTQLGLWYILALCVSWASGLNINFWLSRRFVFQVFWKNSLYQYAIFAIVAINSLLANLGLLQLLIGELGWNSTTARLFSAACVSVLSFTGHKLYTFADRELGSKTHLNLKIRN